MKTSHNGSPGSKDIMPTPSIAVPKDQNGEIICIPIQSLQSSFGKNIPIALEASHSALDKAVLPILPPLFGGQDAKILSVRSFASLCSVGTDMLDCWVEDGDEGGVGGRVSLASGIQLAEVTFFGGVVVELYVDLRHGLHLAKGFEEFVNF